MSKNKKVKNKRARVKAKSISPVERIKRGIVDFFKNPLNKVIFKFSAFLLFFYAFWISPFFQKYIVANVAEAYAQLTAAFLKLFNYPVLVAGDTLGDINFSLSIKNGCDGIEAMAILLTGILVYPSKWKDKFYGLLVGASILIFINLFRIITLYFNGIYTPDFFEFMHTGFWQVMFIIIPLSIIFKWVAWLNNKAIKA